ncbi:Oxidoreductase (NAD-binding), involved in siderophore biosynthesis [Raoultella ornithinolytica]|nr:Oxidoreductase (NAD-binding), involved in siderophore biosynthesis [Raoultella ornithinolytica]
MMQSAIPKQRVLIVGAKFGEMYLNAFMRPGKGLELVGCWPREARDRGSWLMPLVFRCIPPPEQITEMPDIACIVVRSTVAGWHRYAACQTLSDARCARHSGASPPSG